MLQSRISPLNPLAQTVSKNLSGMQGGPGTNLCLGLGCIVCPRATMRSTQPLGFFQSRSVRESIHDVCDSECRTHNTRSRGDCAPDRITVASTNQPAKEIQYFRPICDTRLVRYPPPALPH